MKKSALENQINLVIEKNNSLFSKCSELENELLKREETIKNLMDEIESLQSQNTELNAKIEELNHKQPTSETIFTDDVKMVEEYVSSEVITENNVVETADESYSDKSEKSQNEDTSIYDEKDIDRIINIKSTLITNNKLDLASKAIGRVVIKCTEFCNTFITAGDINSKDLVNLALGRTEVFKSEVLALASSKEISSEMFVAELNLKETSVIEYFELLLKQI